MCMSFTFPTTTHFPFRHTHPTASVAAPVWHRGRALALPASVFRTVGTRAGFSPVGIGSRAWTTVAAVWVTSRMRSENVLYNQWQTTVFDKKNKQTKKATSYLDFDRDRDLDSERLEARDGLGEPDLLSDLTRAGLPWSDLDGERDPYCHSSMLTTFSHTNSFIYLYKNTISSQMWWKYHRVHLSKMYSLYTAGKRVSNHVVSINLSVTYY